MTLANRGRPHPPPQDFSWCHQQISSKLLKSRSKRQKWVLEFSFFNETIWKRNVSLRVLSAMVFSCIPHTLGHRHIWQEFRRCRHVWAIGQAYTAKQTRLQGHLCLWHQLRRQRRRRARFSMVVQTLLRLLGVPWVLRVLRTFKVFRGFRVLRAQILEHYQVLI